MQALAIAALFAAAQQTPQGPLTLENAVAIALERNPDLRRQQLIARQAETDLTIARSAILPHLDFNGSAGRIRVGAGETFIGTTPYRADAPIASGTFLLGLSARQLVFDGGKWWNNLAAGSSGVEAGREQVAEQRIQVTYLVAERFMELVRARRFLRVLEEASARSSEQAAITERLSQRGGRATQADVFAARANRTSDAIAQRRQAAVVERTRLELAAALGLEPSEPLEIQEPPDFDRTPQRPPPLDRAVDLALQRRPVLRAMRAQVEAQSKAAAALVGDYWPAIAVGATYSKDSRSLDKLFDSLDESSVAFVGATVTWNLFGGLANKAQIDRARLQTEILAGDYAAGRRNVAVEVEQAISALIAAVDGVKLAEEGEGAAKEGLREARLRQQAGAGSQFEARDAELRLTQAQLSRVTALADARIARAALTRAIGAEER